MAQQGSQSRSQRLRRLKNAVAGSPAPYANGLIDVALGLSDAAKAAKSNEAACRDLATYSDEIVIKIAESISRATGTLPDSLSRNVAELKQTLEEIRDHMLDLNATGLLASRGYADQNAKIIAMYRERLSSALSKFGYHTAVDLQMRQMETNDLTLLHRLPSVNARWDPDQTCLPDTRVEVIDKIVAWTQSDVDQVNVFWLSGMAGRGKTTIAHSIAQRLYKNGLVSCFFFKRDIADRNGPQLVFSSLAKDLANRNANLRPMIIQALREDDSLAAASPSMQFSELVSKPVQHLLETTSVDEAQPCIVIWDALDECQDSNAWPTFLNILRSGLSKLSPALKFIITSRHLPSIERLLSDAHAVCLSLDQSTVCSEKDLATYIDHGLQDIGYWRMLPDHWYSSSDVSSLVMHAAGLFIWAATALKYIRNSIDPAAELQVLAKEPIAEAESALDALYTRAIMSSKLNNFAKAFQIVVGSIVVLQKPLPCGALSQLTSYQSTHVIINELRAVLALTPPDGNIQLVHQSFADFLTDASRCTLIGYFIDTGLQHIFLAKCCLQTMHKLLQQDTCNVRDSGLLNDEIPDLTSRLQQHVPHELQYACFYWAAHVEKAAVLTEILPLLLSFYTCDVLFWLEVMSLFKQIPLVIKILHNLNVLLDSAAVPKSLMTMSYDALRFAEQFTYILSNCASHIYLSALALTPPATELYGSFHPRFGHSHEGLKVLQGVEPGWCHYHQTLGHPSRVTAVMFSPDGRHICSGSDDMIHMWHAQTGQLALPPLAGHSSSVMSIAFSPDGCYIVSGSLDKTIRLWDAETGDSSSTMFDHQDSVWSVAFSLDSRYIASASADKTVCVWDVETGLCLLCLGGHRGQVYSAAFSHDGLHIVSGSEDMTVRIWHSVTGQPLSCGPFEGHKGSVLSVAFSPDSQHVVSSSDDGTLRIWIVETGQLFLPPLVGHTDSVYSVAFTADGRHIISGSSDKRVGIWDAMTGALLLPFLEGHSHWVTSLSLSPDGYHIASASPDGTVCIWNVDFQQNSLAPVEGPHGMGVLPIHTYDGDHFSPGPAEQAHKLDVHNIGTEPPALSQSGGHTDLVRCIAFSSDGCHIVSGSNDNTVCLWDAKTGQLSLPPFQRHTDLIVKVSFSPDNQYILSASKDATICIWDVHTGEPSLLPLVGRSEELWWAVFSPDSHHFASGSSDGTACVWDVQTGELSLKLSIPPFNGWQGSVESVAFSSNGQFLACGSNDSNVYVWNINTRQLSSPPMTGHNRSVTSVAFSPDGHYIISGSYDTTIRKWDAETGTSLLSPLRGHKHEVMELAFSPDGHHIISGCWDHIVHVWDADTGQLLSMDPSANQGQRLHEPRGGDVFYISEDFWICSLYKGRICWIPPLQRGPSAFSTDTVALGNGAGKMTIIRLF